jgi:hypothetical protein
MEIVRKLITLAAALFVAASTTASAQERHVVDPATLAATMAQHVDRQDADRAAIREALARPEVRDIAGRIGLDVDRAMTAVDTLGGADLDRAATAARDVNQQLVGGANVVLSTTTIIVILLVVILIIVAVK